MLKLKHHTSTVERTSQKRRPDLQEKRTLQTLRRELVRASAPEL